MLSSTSRRGQGHAAHWPGRAVQQVLRRRGNREPNQGSRLPGRQAGRLGRGMGAASSSATHEPDKPVAFPGTEGSSKGPPRPPPKGPKHAHLRPPVEASFSRCSDSRAFSARHSGRSTAKVAHCPASHSAARGPSSAAQAAAGQSRGIACIMYADCMRRAVLGKIGSGSRPPCCVQGLGRPSCRRFGPCRCLRPPRPHAAHSAGKLHPPEPENCKLLREQTLTVQQAFGQVEATATASTHPC